MRFYIPHIRMFFFTTAEMPFDQDPHFNHFPEIFKASLHGLVNLVGGVAEHVPLVAGSDVLDGLG